MAMILFPKLNNRREFGVERVRRENHSMVEMALIRIGHTCPSLRHLYIYKRCLLSYLRK